jgi:adenosylcobinamide-GDP ribazoletransferase
MALVRQWLLALQFFTRIPVTGRLARWTGHSSEMARMSNAHLPGIGVLVGGFAALVSWLALIALPSSIFSLAVAIVLGMAASIWMTGALHEDGLADFADGIGGGATRERALEIMKDSRIGSFGAVALVLALLLKCALLAVLIDKDRHFGLAAIVFANASSRIFPLWAIERLDYVGDIATSRSADRAKRLNGRGWLIAIAWLFTSLLILQWLGALDRHWQACLLGAGMGLSAFGYLWRLCRRRLQGYTGDALGAIQQITELAIYFGCALGLG